MPHDWSIEGPFDQNAPTLGNGGYLPAGIGWYRKHFTLPASQQGKRIFVEFDGVMANADIYINGTSLGTRANGYMSFRYEITSQAVFGGSGNVIAVRANNSSQPASRWYAGAGIYRHVRIDRDRSGARRAVGDVRHHADGVDQQRDRARRRPPSRTRARRRRA